MYSFNFSKDDKKRKSGDFETLSSANYSLEDGFADSGFNAGSAGDFEPLADGSNGNASSNKDFVSVPLTPDNGINGKGGDSVPISARGMLAKNYKDDAAWSGRFFNYVNPKASPERGGVLYSASPKALDDVTADYYKNELSPLYEDNLSTARERSNKAFSDYSSDPIAAMRKVRESYDPIALIDKTMQQVDTAKLREMVEPLARRAGFDTEMYIEDYVKPVLHDMLLTNYIDDNKPKNSGEYIFRSALMNSLVGKGANMAMGNKQYVRLENESLASYEPSRLEKFAASVGSLLVDAPVFAGFGSLSGRLVGKVSSMAANKLASRIFSYKAAEGMTKYQAARIAERAIVSNLRNKIVQSAAIQGLTLGNYDLSHSIADDVIYNEGIDAGKAVGSFLKGAATGGVSGAVGSRLNWATKGLTGGRRMLASTGVLSAESAVFTLSAEMDKLAHDVEIEPIDLVYDYGESLATLGVMKMTHWRPKGAENKLKSDGTLKDELKLSKSEQAELREINVDPVQFMAEVEKALNLPSYGIGSARNGITEKYLEMMQSKDLSAATKSKLMYLVENKLTSTPPVPFDYGIEQSRSGEWVFTTYDFNGNKVERRVFEHLGKVKNHLFLEKGKLRNNRIAAYEQELLQGIDSQNLLRQAGLYAKEKSVSVDDISQALYKRACNVKLSGWESMLVREIVDRASYDQSGMVQYLADMRRNVEKKYGLDDGALLVNVKEPFYRCTEAENRALDEYEALVRDEVNALKQGTDNARAAEFRKLGEESRFKGMSNDEVKARELEDYYTAHPQKQEPEEFEVKPIKIDDDKPSEYVWSYGGVNNTVEDINSYEAYAREYVRRFNYDVEFIRNEREIPYPDVNDKRDVQAYNNRIRSMGWLDKNGKIAINLPNIGSVEELEKTVVHECVAHGGLLKLFGNHLNTFLEEVYRKSSSDVRGAIGNIQAKYRFADNFTVIEEYLAELSEKAVVSPGERSWLTNVKNFVKNMLVRTNLYTGRNRRITEEDLNELLRQHAKYVEKRTEPSRYRRWVFGLFDAAKQNEDTYYNRDVYEQDVRNKIAGGKYFINTPDPLYNTKLLQNYDLLPDAKRREVLDRWRSTDEQVRNLLSTTKHRVGEDNADALPENATLKDLYNDQSFYTRYPELANLPVEVVEGMEKPVSYDAMNKKLVVDRSFLASPEKATYMPGVLQNVARDYESFNKAVLMNMQGIASKLELKYKEARKFLEGINSAKRSIPRFDMRGDIRWAFEREYGFSPDEFAKRFPTLEDYTLYKLTGQKVVFSDDVVPPAERVKKHSGSVINDIGDLMKFFNGPLDIVYEKLQQGYSDEPRKVKTETKNDFGFGEFKKKQDEKSKQLSDIVENREWRDAFRHLGDELDVLN